MKILQEALTFDDVLIQPNYSEILPHQANVASYFSKNIKLNVPIVSAAMDTVTEKDMAILLAQQGGIGVIHKNMPITEQKEQIKVVKRFANHMIYNPITVTSSTGIDEVRAIKKNHNISSIPVVDGNQLVGIVTARDIRMAQPHNVLKDIMTTQENLITAKSSDTREDIIRLMHKNRVEQILIMDDKSALLAIVALKDVERQKIYPNATIDSDGRLRVAGGVGVGDAEKERIRALVDAGVDALVIDTAHGHSKGVIEQLQWCKKQSFNVDVVVGNIATVDGARSLIDAGADALKVGIGPGSICTTRIISGVGVPQVSAIMNVRQLTHKENVPLIADGGIRFSGDIGKAIVAGANSVMLGSILAGTEQAPGAVEYYQGRPYKTYRGMGSIGAMAKKYGSSDRYFQDNNDAKKLVPEGIEGRVPYKGSAYDVLHQLVGGLRACMGYTGSKTIGNLQESSLLKITHAGVKESHVHDVSITKESPNYGV